MTASASNLPLLTITRKLGMGQITGAEILFLIRRIRCEPGASGWTGLTSLYGQNEDELRNLENIVLRRLSFDGVTQVEAWLDGWAGEDYINRLSSTERTNLKTLVEDALWLHILALRHKQARPAVHPLLAGNERDQLLALEKAHLPQKTLRVPPKKTDSKPKPAKGKKAKARTQTTPKPVKAQRAANDLQVGNEVFLACPIVILNDATQQERFFENLVRLHLWLNEALRTVGEMRQMTATLWRPMIQADFQRTLDLFFTLGVIGRTNGSQTSVTVSPTLSSKLTIAQVRLACAESFVKRIDGNHALLAAVDHLSYAPLERIKVAAFGDEVVLDLEFRLRVFAALGMVQAEKKQAWSISQAGRDLVASMPSVQLTVANVTEALPTSPDTDWLDVL